MLPDYLREHLDIVFVGINPGTYSDAKGHYFARSTNLFWTALYESGFVNEPLTPQDDVRMNEFGYGLTDLVARPTPNMDTLTRAEFARGGEILRAKLLRYTPRIACFVGITGYRIAYNKRAQFGLQSSSPTWGNPKIFIVPSTSPRNAYYRTHVIDWFKRLKEFSDTW